MGEQQVEFATESLRQKLGDLTGKTFLDIGSGSGLHSLAALLLGASNVHSFDYDRESVATTLEIRRRFRPSAPWTIEQGSVLDLEYLRSLGCFDVVYSWGVLHHTGSMWSALRNVACPVSSAGILFISIYNDQGYRSQLWRRLKRFHCDSGPLGKRSAELATFFATWGSRIPFDILRLKPLRSFREWKNYYGLQRGMSPWRDIVDWAGGYPFEVAKPEQIFRFYRDLGFILEELETCGGGLGCNEFVFRRAR